MNLLNYRYDPMGNRTAKHVTTNQAAGQPKYTQTTLYVRDAQGNVIPAPLPMLPPNPHQ